MTGSRSTDSFEALNGSWSRTWNSAGRFLVYAAFGAGVGLLVAGLEWVAADLLLEEVSGAPTWVRVATPPVGVVAAVTLLQLAGRVSASTSDLYVKAFHGDAQLEGRVIAPKLTAAVATVGGGAAVGLEGPAIFAGSSLGAVLARRWPWVTSGRHPRVLLAAGAAAGVASVFKAPATGVLFALEAPFRRDVARQALIPALVAASAAYTSLVVVLGADRLLTVPLSEVTLRQEILGAVVIGVIAGVAARATAHVFHVAKSLTTVRASRRLPVAAALMLAAGLVAGELVDEPVLLGPGAEAAVEIALDPGYSFWIIAALFVLRAVATSAALGAGGVGGVFIPLVVQGLFLGRLAEFVFDAPTPGLLPIVGLAAMLGAGYRTPLAAVMFVAETTGRAEFVIPALLATAISQSLMGDASVSSGQIDERQGVLEARLDRPAGEVAIPIAAPARVEDSLLDIVDRIGGRDDTGVVPVVEGTYSGILVLADIAHAVLEYGVEAEVGRVVRFVPAVAATAPAAAAADIMRQHNTAAVVVTDVDDQPVGLITAASLAGVIALD